MSTAEDDVRYGRAARWLRERESDYRYRASPVPADSIDVEMIDAVYGPCCSAVLSVGLRTFAFRYARDRDNFERDHADLTGAVEQRSDTR